VINNLHQSRKPTVVVEAALQVRKQRTKRRGADNDVACAISLK
jgi:hypothetical protein